MRQVLIQKTEVTEPAQWLTGLVKVACGSMWESLQMQAERGGLLWRACLGPEGQGQLTVKTVLMRAQMRVRTLSSEKLS